MHQYIKYSTQYYGNEFKRNYKDKTESLKQRCPLWEAPAIPTPVIPTVPLCHAVRASSESNGNGQISTPRGSKTDFYEQLR